MRSLTLTLLFVVITAALPAQIRKGDRVLTPYNESPTSFSTPPTAITSNVGGFFVSPGGESMVLNVLPQYGFALSDRVVVGAALAVSISFGNDGIAGGLSPFARYYVVNNPDLMVFGGLRGSISLNESNRFVDVSSSFQPHVGLGLPLSPGILFAPELGYTIIGRRNQVNLSLGFDFILGRNTREEELVWGNYGRGSWMFGTQLGGVGITERSTFLRFMPEAYYFLSRRFALGITAGTTLTRFEVTSRRIRAQQNHVGLTGRYFPVQGRHFDLFAHAGFQLEFDERNFGRRPTGDLLVDNLVIMDGGLGGLLFLRRNIALEAGVNLRVYPQLENFELGLSSGIRFFLGGRAGAK